jgi:hypothetical protein
VNVLPVPRVLSNEVALGAKEEVEVRRGLVDRAEVDRLFHGVRVPK